MTCRGDVAGTEETTCRGDGVKRNENINLK